MKPGVHVRRQRPSPRVLRDEEEAVDSAAESVRGGLKWLDRVALMSRVSLELSIHIIIV
jgi:hypothetical protein